MSSVSSWENRCSATAAAANANPSSSSEATAAGRRRVRRTAGSSCVGAIDGAGGAEMLI